MKITYKGDYALKALLQLALKYDEGAGEVAAISEIAADGDMPTKFLEQILLLLKKGGFVKARRGASGGFCLARPPAKITIGEVVRFIEGPIEPISCVGEDCYKGCKDTASCMFRGVWKEVSMAISLVVDTITFEDLVIRHKEKTLKINPISNYTI
ncbi:MAG: Rrf2 family transcriptional regulator [Candidatus Omnitrophota bacterium]